MPDTTITTTDQSLEALLRTEADFPGYSLDLCSGYVSTDGVLLLKRMLKKAPRVRAVVGLNLTNRVSAFQMLRDDCGVEVYVSITRPYTLFEFAENTKLEYAYQMLLLLVMLRRADENGLFSVEEAALYFAEFYRLRREAGLASERSYRSKRAVVDNPRTSLSQMLKTSSFPQFERQGLLDMSEDGRYFVVNPALLEALTPSLKLDLSALAVRRMADHFGDDEFLVGAMVERAIGR